ncbi:MAG: FcoT family thioesterase [Nanoarchaeota archaeon]
MKVSKKNIGKVLSLYKPNYRFLEEVDIEFPCAMGKFRLKEAEYVETLRHVTDIEAQLCLNQLSYVFFGQQIIDRRWQDIKNLSFDEYLNLRKEDMFIVESKKKFVREIDSLSAFSGEIKLLDMKKIRRIHLASLDFSLNDGACYGSLKLVLRIKDNL